MFFDDFIRADLYDLRAGLATVVLVRRVRKDIDRFFCNVVGVLVFCVKSRSFPDIGEKWQQGRHGDEKRDDCHNDVVPLPTCESVSATCGRDDEITPRMC